MSRQFRDRFLDKICEWDWLFSLVLAADVVLLVLLGLTFYLSVPSEGSRVVSILALVFILGSLIAAASLLRVCRAREDVNLEAMDN